MDKALLATPTIKNRAGGTAYAPSNKEALAQYAATGFFGDTYYVTAKEQLADVLKLCENVPDEYIAKCAIYARQKGYLKDMPAVLLAVLAARRSKHFRHTFDGVVDNGKMLANFVTILRSGITGRRGLGHAPRKKIEAWLANRTPRQLHKDALSDLKQVLKLVRPQTFNPERNALYAYLTGPEVNVCRPRKLDGSIDRDMIAHIVQRVTADQQQYVTNENDGTVIVTRYNADVLPGFIKEYELFRQNREGAVPDVDWRYLDSLQLTDAEWIQVAKRAPFLMTLKNLNTFERHNCFKDPEVVQAVTDRLRNKEAIAYAKVFPYQILTAYKARQANDPWSFKSTGPDEITKALNDAMELAIENVPYLDANVAIALDVSGSMGGLVTGRGSTRYVDAAALFAAAIMRRSRSSLVLPFDTRCFVAQAHQGMTVLGFAEQLAKWGGGGTNCSLPLQQINQRALRPDIVVFVSDNESWADRGGGMKKEWARLKARAPKAKLVCIDIAAATSHQVPTSPDCLNVGGFSDAVFSVVTDFLTGDRTKWVDHVEAIAL